MNIVFTSLISSRFSSRHLRWAALPVALSMLPAVARRNASCNRAVLHRIRADFHTAQFREAASFRSHAMEIGAIVCRSRPRPRVAPP